MRPDSTQTYFWIGNIGVARTYPQRAALEITNTAFGGSFGSMLMQALRVRSGLTYSARFGISPRQRAGGVLRSAPSPRRRARPGRVDDCARDAGCAQAGEPARPRHRFGAQLHPRASTRSGFETAADWATALAELDLYDLPESNIDEFPDALRGVDARAVAPGHRRARSPTAMMWTSC